MYVIVLLSLLVISIYQSCCVPLTYDPFLDAQWVKFKLDHNKYYSVEEDAIRKNIWSRHKIDIDAHNVEADMQWNSYHMKYNHFTDMTVQEISSYTKHSIESSVRGARLYSTSGHELPEQVDWRDLGWVSPVVNQFACSSDWAIAAAGVIEAQIMNKTGTLTSVSVQHLIDCSDQNNGCMGGTSDIAIKQLLNNADQTIELASCKPYLATKNMCQRNKELVTKYMKTYHIGSLIASAPIDEAMRELRHLRANIEKLGLFKPSRMFYSLFVIQILSFEWLAYLTISYYGSNWLSWLLAAALFATSQAQAGWLQHDFGHMSVFKDNRWNHVAHHLVIGLFKGASSHWWNFRHQQHHVKPNTIRKDPDISVPYIFLIGKVLPREWGVKKRGFMPYNLQHRYFFIFGPPLLLPVYFHFEVLYFVIKRKDWLVRFVCTITMLMYIGCGSQLV